MLGQELVRNDDQRLCGLFQLVVFHYRYGYVFRKPTIPKAMLPDLVIGAFGSRTTSLAAASPSTTMAKTA